MGRSLREHLKQAFTRSGWTYEELARRTGLSRASVFRKLNGDQPLMDDEIELFARLLGVRVEVTVRDAGA